MSYGNQTYGGPSPYGQEATVSSVNTTLSVSASTLASVAITNGVTNILVSSVGNASISVTNAIKGT